MQTAAHPKFTKRYKFVTQEKAAGATYTPTPLADFVATQMLRAADLAGEGPLRILDPAVGDGELLLSLLKQLQPRTRRPIEIHGFEMDAAALGTAVRRLRAAFPEATIHLQRRDFLDYVLSTASGGNLLSEAPQVLFDLVIANPPYVRTQIMGAQQAQALAQAFSLSGRVDLYFAFLIGIALVLRGGGTAGVIASNRFMTTRAGAAVRAELRTRFAIRHIFDMGDTKLFTAAVLPAVLIVEGRNGHDPSPPAFTTIYETEADATYSANDPVEALAHTGVVAVPDGRRFQVRHGILDLSQPAEEVWRITTDAGDSWLATVARHTWATFGDIGKIRVGVKTCADKVFIRSDWHELPEAQQPELLRPLTTHHIARRFRAVVPKKHILYPHTTVQGERQAVDLAGYPKSRAYLEAHRTVLEGRTYVIEAGRRWYEIWVPQDPSAWGEPKLVFRDIAEKPTFWIDLDRTIVNGDCYWMIADRPEYQEVLWLAAAVANSTFSEAFYDHRFNNKLYAGRRRFMTQYVELFPLPDPETALAREIIAAAKALYDAAGTPEAEQLELQLDKMVWRAFGLA